MKTRNCLILSILLGMLLFIFCMPTWIIWATPSKSTDTQYGKVLILNFDDNRISQYVEAKPILDKYGFKATFYVVCKYLDNKKGYMNWSQIEALQKDGHEIGSHTMNHANLSASSKKKP